MSNETLTLRGILTGHNGWVTSIAYSKADPEKQNAENILISGSRDKSIIVWDLSESDPSTLTIGYPKRSLTGHSHFVEDVVLSSDAQFALSCSWDKTLRLWDLNEGVTTRTFIGHTNDVLSVAFSADNRQIVSGSRDKTLKLWNTLGECKRTINNEDAHTEWVSCVRFSPNSENPLVVSSGWDKYVKIWNLRDCTLRNTLPDEDPNTPGHTGYINTVTVSPDGSLCASGGKDGIAMLWDLTDGKHLYTLEAGDIINALAFSPNRYWLAAATNSKIIVWDLERKSEVCKLDKTIPDFFGIGVEKSKVAPNPACLSITWSADGTMLFAGYSDHLIRAFEVRLAN